VCCSSSKVIINFFKVFYTYNNEVIIMFEKKKLSNCFTMFERESARARGEKKRERARERKIERDGSTDYYY